MVEGTLQEREVFELIKKYNVLFKSQVYAYFGQERAVGRAFKRLEKITASGAARLLRWYI